MNEPSFDVIVIGAGIHGAGCAQGVTLNGYSCLVLEKSSSVASATSSRSSKLIHGGLRYLESLQFKLVRQCLREQALLLKNAPDLVKTIPFYIPVYKNSSRKPWQIHTGLMLYKLLGGHDYRIVPEHEWPSLRGLKTNNLLKVFQYQDAQTDDKKLTRAVMRSAKNYGAKLYRNSQFISAEKTDDGYIVSYRKNKATHQLHTRFLINAAGPWVTNINQHISPAPESVAVELIAGTHIVIDRITKPGIFYIESPSDKRAVFVMPWQEQYTLIGTTETFYTGNPDDVKPSAQEIDYLLHNYNHYFNTPISHSNIVKSFAGLRVLPSPSGTKKAKHVFQRSRESKIQYDKKQHPRLICIYGGKLTAYRATAETVARTVHKCLGNKPGKKPAFKNTTDISLQDH